MTGPGTRGDEVGRPRTGRPGCRVSPASVWQSRRMFRVGWIARTLIVLVVLLVALAVVGDLLIRSEAQKHVASRIRSETGAQTVTVHAGSFPFMYEVLVSKLSTVDIVATGVPVGPLRLSQVTVHAHQVKVDRHALIFDQKLNVSSVSSATVAVLVKTSALPSLLNAFDTHVSLVDGHELVVTAVGRQVLSVNLTSNRLVPNCDFSLQQVADGYQLSCTLSPVPQSLLATLSARAG